MSDAKLRVPDWHTWQPVPEPEGNVPHNQYLQRRRQTWYFRLAVPAKLVPLAGKEHVVKSLQTREAAVARQRRWGMLAAVREWFGRLADEGGLWTDDADEDSARNPIEVGIEWRGALREAAKLDPLVRKAQAAGAGEWRPYTDEEREARDNLAGPFFAAEDVAEAIGKRQGAQARVTFEKIVYSKSPPIAEISEAWLVDIKGIRSLKTIDQYRSALALLREACPELVVLDQVDRRAAGEFATWLRTTPIKETGQPRAAATQRRTLYTLSTLWAWLRRKGHVEGENPWHGQADDLGAIMEAGRADDDDADGRDVRPYTAEELVKLLSGEPAPPKRGPHDEGRDGALRELAVLGLMTGARLNELASLGPGDILAGERAIRIRGGVGKSRKSKAAVRTIPVHGWVWPLVARRVAEAADGALFPEFPPDKRYGRRGVWRPRRSPASGGGC